MRDILRDALERPERAFPKFLAFLQQKGVVSINMAMRNSQRRALLTGPNGKGEFFEGTVYPLLLDRRLIGQLQIITDPPAVFYNGEVPGFVPGTPRVIGNPADTALGYEWQNWEGRRHRTDGNLEIPFP